MTNTTSRWNDWMGRARLCCRATTAIDNTTATVHHAVTELEATQAPIARDAVEALRSAEAALLRAREAVEAAMKARKLTAANREVSYGLAG